MLAPDVLEQRCALDATEGLALVSRDEVAKPRYPNQQFLLFEELQGLAAGRTRMPKLPAEHSYRRHRTTRCERTGQDLFSEPCCQPNVRPRVSFAKVGRPDHTYNSMSKVYHPSPWSSSLADRRWTPA